MHNIPRTPTLKETLFVLFASEIIVKLLLIVRVYMPILPIVTEEKISEVLAGETLSSDGNFVTILVFRGGGVPSCSQVTKVLALNLLRKRTVSLAGSLSLYSFRREGS